MLQKLTRWAKKNKHLLINILPVFALIIVTIALSEISYQKVDTLIVSNNNLQKNSPFVTEPKLPSSGIIAVNHSNPVQKHSLITPTISLNHTSLIPQSTNEDQNNTMQPPSVDVGQTNGKTSISTNNQPQNNSSSNIGNSNNSTSTVQPTDKQQLSTVTPTSTPNYSTPTPTCIPRPACLNAVPQCMIMEPVGGWCHNKT